MATAAGAARNPDAATTASVPCAASARVRAAGSGVIPIRSPRPRAARADATGRAGCTARGPVSTLPWPCGTTRATQARCTHFSPPARATRTRTSPAECPKGWAACRP